MNQNVQLQEELRLWGRLTWLLVLLWIHYDLKKKKKFWDSLSTVFAPDKQCLEEDSVSMQLTEIKIGCPSTVITT